MYWIRFHLFRLKLGMVIFGQNYKFRPMWCVWRLWSFSRPLKPASMPLNKGRVYWISESRHLLKYGFCKKLQLLLIWKKGGQKGSTGQRFICIEVTSYKIHTLTVFLISRAKPKEGQSLPKEWKILQGWHYHFTL